MSERIRLVQFVRAEQDRRLGVVLGDSVADLTSALPEIRTTYQLFFRARSTNSRLEDFLQQFQTDPLDRIPYSILLEGKSSGGYPYLLAPLDHPDPAHCLISGTGLTHLGSARQRDGMHDADLPVETEVKTDSQKMFEWGLLRGKPDDGRGVQPEWFYKGSGLILRSHNDYLDIPAFALDGGEEPEIVGCYVIDRDGKPHRIGFAIGNEWSDHVMEKENYLWLAPSKLRTCSVGPELVINETFSHLRGHVRILRKGGLIYDSGEILTGEANMSHSLANLEDHHFKYPQFRHPGDVHLHFFGTMKMSYGSCPLLKEGDRVEVQFEGMGPALVNFVRITECGREPVGVEF